MIMSTIIRSALVAIALLASASAAMARPVVDEARHHQQQYDSSTDRAWAFWDAQQRNGS
jgi:hypothetical protein